MIAALLAAAPLAAQETLVTFRFLAPDVALEMAEAALDSCRKNGFQVAVTVVDRMGVAQVMLRDRFAGAGAASFVVARALLGVGLPTGRGETRVDVLGATNKGSEAIHAGVTALDLPVAAVAGGKPHVAALFEAGLSIIPWVCGRGDRPRRRLRYRRGGLAE